MKKLIILFVLILFLGGVSAVCEEGQIDINNASKEELTEIKHIGDIRANEIIELRTEKLFESVDDLVRVSGIVAGGSRLSDIKQEGLACVNGEIEKPEELNEAEEEEEEENEEEIEIEETQEPEPIYYEETDKEEEVKLEIIKLKPLNSKDIKTEDNNEESNKNTYAKYGFVVFCILLGFLFILKKRKNYKTEFEENENKEE